MGCLWYGYGMRARYLRLTSKKAQDLSALKKEAEGDGAFRVAKRIHAVLLNDQQHSSGEIARLLEAPRSKVSLWLGQYEEYGWKALLEGHRSGHPRRVSGRLPSWSCAQFAQGFGLLGPTSAQTSGQG